MRYIFLSLFIFITLSIQSIGNVYQDARTDSIGNHSGIGYKDVSSIQNNPAALPYTRSQLKFTYSNAWETQNIIGEQAFNFNDTVGIGIRYFQSTVDDIAITTREGNTGSFSGQRESLKYATFSIGGGVSIIKDFLSVGTTLHFDQNKFWTKNSENIRADTGILLNIGTYVEIAGTLKNIYQKGIIWNTGKEETLPSEQQLSAGLILNSIGLPNIYGTLLSNSETSYLFGAEWKAGPLVFRSVYDDNFGYGIGLNLDTLFLDITWVNESEINETSYKFSVGFLN